MVFLVLLAFLAFIYLLVSLINPKAITFGVLKTRKSAALSLLGAFVLFIAFVSNMPSADKGDAMTVPAQAKTASLTASEDKAAKKQAADEAKAKAAAEAEAKKKAEEEAKAKAAEEAKAKAEAAAAAKAEAEAKAKEPISTNFKEFETPYQSMTDLQKDDFWSKVKGRYVQWSGEVTYVTKDSIGIKVLNSTLTYDFLARMGSNMKEELLKINKGDKLTINGKLSSKEGAILPWSLDDGQIMK